MDKIAFFIDDYLQLKIEPWKIDFRKIWYLKWNKNPEKRIINDEIKNTKNPGLNALFNIHGDLEDGAYQELKDIRNAITHRFIKIKMFCKSEDGENLTENTLIERTLELARIVRNSIIYLLYFVDIEESRKRKESDLELPPLVAEEIPDYLKSHR